MVSPFTKKYTLFQQCCGSVRLYSCKEQKTTHIFNPTLLIPTGDPTTLIFVFTDLLKTQTNLICSFILTTSFPHSRQCLLRGDVEDDEEEEQPRGETSILMCTSCSSLLLLWWCWWWCCCWWCWWWWWWWSSSSSSITPPPPPPAVVGFRSLCLRRGWDQDWEFANNIGTCPFLISLNDSPIFLLELGISRIPGKINIWSKWRAQGLCKHAREVRSPALLNRLKLGNLPLPGSGSMTYHLLCKRLLKLSSITVHWPVLRIRIYY